MSPHQLATPCAHPRCPKLTLYRFCSEHRTEHSRNLQQRRGKTRKRGYGGNWRKLRGVVLREEPLCRECLKRNGAALATRSTFDFRRRLIHVRRNCPANNPLTTPKTKGSIRRVDMTPQLAGAMKKVRKRQMAGILKRGNQETLKWAFLSHTWISMLTGWRREGTGAKWIG